MKRFQLRTLFQPRRNRALAAAVVLALGLGVVTVLPSHAPAANGSVVAADLAAGNRTPAHVDRNFSRELAFPDDCPKRPDGTCLTDPPRGTVYVAPVVPPVAPAAPAKANPPHKKAPKKPATKHKKSSSSSGTSTGPSVNTGGGCAPAVRLPSNVASIIDQLAGGTCNAAMWKWITKHESGGNVHATNGKGPNRACGIPQAKPCNKLASAGTGWWDSALLQLRWMLSYMKGRYGSIAGTYRHWRAQGWY